VTSAATTKLIGELIRQARVGRGWSQRELGARLGVTATAITYYEQGSRRCSAADVVAIARELGVEPGSLLPGLTGDTPDPLPRAGTPGPWRQGHDGRTLYGLVPGQPHDQMIGVMDTIADAALVVAAVDRYDPCQGTQWACEAHGAHPLVGPGSCDPAVAMPCPRCTPPAGSRTEPPGPGEPTELEENR
jgi:DNA-binding XRE family transcriptional regulator